MIKKIILEIGNKEIKLTLDQALELQELLNDTFGDTVYVDRPTYPKPWQQPYWYTNYGTCSSTDTANFNADVDNITYTDTMRFCVK